MTKPCLGVFHDNSNMGASRLCVFLTVLVSVKMISSEPIFGTRFWCDLMCDDDDDDYSDYDIFDFLDPCVGCTTKKPTKNKMTTQSPGMQQPFNLVIPPANGMNVTIANNGGNSWLMNFMPWAYKPAGTTAAPATTAQPATTAAGTTAAKSTTAAPSTTAKA